ncbi:MAG: hypothetical protein Q9177_003565, partial [Variospora cf. flavescens]
MPSSTSLYPTLYPIFCFLAEIVLITLILSFTAASSPLRPALLPILVLTAASAVSYSPVAFNRSGWTSFLSADIIISVFHYVETALISGWDFDHGGPTRSRALPAPKTISKTQAEPLRKLPPPENDSPAENGLLERLRFGYLVATTSRNIGTPFLVKNTPPFSYRDPNYVPSRTRFCLWGLCTIAAAFMVIDLVESSSPPTTLQENAVRYSPSAVNIFTGRRENLMPAQASTRLVVVLLYWFCIAILFDAVHKFFAICSVLLYIKDVRHYRPNFGSLTEAYTIRQFWGVFWHQHHRKRFCAPIDVLVYDCLRLRRGTLLARYTHLAMVFLLSGLFHKLVDLGEWYGWRHSGQLHFFVTQVVGILLEDGVQAVYRRWCG